MKARQLTLNIGFLGAEPVSGNKGCEALTYSILYLLEEIAQNKRIRFNYFILSGYKRARKIQFRIGMRSIPVEVLPLPGFDTLPNLLYTIVRSRYISKYLNLDYVLAIGLGDSFSDIYGKECFRMINNPIRLFERLGKPVIFLPQTIGPFESKQTSKAAIKSLNAAAGIMTRDALSTAFVRQYADRKKVDEIIDIAFALPYERLKIPQEKILHIGLNISALLWQKDAATRFGLITDYQQLTRSLLDCLLAYPNIRVHLVPHVVYGDALTIDDYNISYHLLQDYQDDRIVLAPFFKDPVLAKSYIGALDFFIGARMHACIAAFSSGTPVFPLAYSRKFGGLFRETLRYPYLGDLTTMNESMILTEVRTSLDGLEQISEIIKERTQTVVQERLNLFKALLVDYMQIK